MPTASHPVRGRSRVYWPRPSARPRGTGALRLPGAPLSRPTGIPAGRAWQRPRHSGGHASVATVSHGRSESRVTSTTQGQMRAFATSPDHECLCAPSAWPSAEPGSAAANHPGAQSGRRRGPALGAPAVPSCSACRPSPRRWRVAAASRPVAAKRRLTNPHLGVGRADYGEGTDDLARSGRLLGHRPYLQHDLGDGLGPAEPGASSLRWISGMY